MSLLRSPKWLLGHLIVAVLFAACLVLGFWQVDRAGERRLENTVYAGRASQPVTDVAELVEGAGEDVASLEHRRARATGRFVPAEEVLVRSRVYDGVAGFGVVTPLVLEGDGAVLVDRGWVPLDLDAVPVAAAPPPSGTVTVEGVVRAPASRSVGGTPALAGPIVNRVDIEVIGRQTNGPLLPVYLELVGEAEATVLPMRSPPPLYDDPGAHLAYAVQWFSFALVGLVGYGFLIRRAARRPSL